MTAVALRALPRQTPATPDRHRRVAPIALHVDRTLYMCAVAQGRERRGEPAAAFHGFCRGRATSVARVLGTLPDPDGRFSPGRHVCTCPCHAAAEEPATSAT